VRKLDDHAAGRNGCRPPIALVGVTTDFAARAMSCAARVAMAGD
jgi:hypothetical protein